jgi:predicted ATP-dependent endonuclease of OLD family
MTTNNDLKTLLLNAQTRVNPGFSKYTNALAENAAMSQAIDIISDLNQQNLEKIDALETEKAEILDLTATNVSLSNQLTEKMAEVASENETLKAVNEALGELVEGMVQEKTNICVHLELLANLEDVTQLKQQIAFIAKNIARTI